MMNARGIYDRLQQENDSLLNVKHRLRKITDFIAGPSMNKQINAAPIGGTNLGLAPTPAQPRTYINDLDNITSANRDIISSLYADLEWLESVFEMNADAPSAEYAPGEGYATSLRSAGQHPGGY